MTTLEIVFRHAFGVFLLWLGWLVYTDYLTQWSVRRWPLRGDARHRTWGLHRAIRLTTAALLALAATTAFADNSRGGWITQLQMIAYVGVAIHGITVAISNYLSANRTRSGQSRQHPSVG